MLSLIASTISILAAAVTEGEGLKAIGAGLGYGLAAIGPGVGIGIVVGAAQMHGGAVGERESVEVVAQALLRAAQAREHGPVCKEYFPELLVSMFAQIFQLLASSKYRSQVKPIPSEVHNAVIIT